METAYRRSWGIRPPCRSHVLELYVKIVSHKHYTIQLRLRKKTTALRMIPPRGNCVNLGMGLLVVKCPHTFPWVQLFHTLSLQLYYSTHSTWLIANFTPFVTNSTISLQHIRRQTTKPPTSPGSTFTACACGLKADEYILNAMSRFVQEFLDDDAGE